MDSSFNLADIKSVVDGNEGFGMGGGMWLVILLLFLGRGGFGFGGGDASLNTDFAILERKLDGITNGICQSEYENARLSANTDLAMANGFSGIQAQIADCCCKTQQAVHAEGEATRAMIRENEIQTLRDQVSALQLNAAMCGVVKYPTATTYATQCNPFGGYACNGAY